jgi:serine phosphatase RsbU (regulator of sigma subunit)
MSLRYRLIAFSVILALIPVFVAGRTMIRITRDELKSSARDQLLSVAQNVTQEIEDFYRNTWLAPLNLLRKAVESENLHPNEKVSYLAEGMKSLGDIVSIQLSVSGVAAPLMVIADDFSRRVPETDATRMLEIPEGRIQDFLSGGESITADLTYLKPQKVWLVTVMMRLSESAFRRPAVMSAQINLDRLKDRIDNFPHNETHTIFIIDARGRRVFDPQQPDLSDLSLVKTAKRLMTAETATIGVELYVRPTGERMLGAYAIPQALELGVIVEQSEADAYQAVSRMENNLIIWIIIGFLIAVIGAVIVSFSLTRPLHRLTHAAHAISQGDLSMRITELSRSDEIGMLSSAFNKMVTDLGRHIDLLTEATKAKERVESEIKLAAAIQESFHPKTFPETVDFDVWGACYPAREVGGDYFDVFAIDEDRYGFVIGDVSGKGLAAAMFMAVSRTLFRVLAVDNRPTDQVMTEFNERLVELDKGSNMFITLLYAVYDRTTRMISYTTAGHHMPYLYSPGDNGNRFFLLPPMETMVAGMMGGIEMKRAERKMKPGDVVVLYTDGLIEAMDDAEELFGEDRLEETLNTCTHLSPREICHRVVNTVFKHQIEEPQFDDMTLLVVRMK